MNERNRVRSGQEAIVLQSLYQVYMGYDVTASRAPREAAQFFQGVAASNEGELGALRVKNSANEVALATAEEQIRSLQKQSTALRRGQGLGAVVSLLGAVLIGFGVNYLTSEVSTPGWVMLVLGGLLQLGVVVATFVNRE